MKNVLYKKEGHIAIITINRPQVLNALDSQTMEELIHSFEMVNGDKDVYCAIMKGAGEKAFCAGGDIKEEITKTALTAYDFALLGKKCISHIYHLRVPLICAVNGYALGAGMEMILASDITVASDTVKIGMPTIKLGTIPAWGSTQMLPRTVGISRAKELLYTGRSLHAQEALDLGVVEFVVQKEELLKKAREIAEEIVDMAPIAIESMKVAINTGMETDMERAGVIETGLFSKCYGTKDRTEAMLAFLEKRDHRTYEGC